MIYICQIGDERVFEGLVQLDVVIRKNILSTDHEKSESVSESFYGLTTCQQPSTETASPLACRLPLSQ